MKFKLAVPEGSKIPWYYGHAYFDYDHIGYNNETFYLIPFNWLFKCKRQFSIWWYKQLFHRDWVDEIILSKTIQLHKELDSALKELAKYQDTYYLLEKYNNIIGRDE